jgi:hypothetical protein
MVANQPQLLRRPPDDPWSNVMSEVPPTPQYPQQPQEQPPAYDPSAQHAQQSGWQPAAQPVAAKSRTTLWITLSLVAVLLLCLGGTGLGAAFYWLGKDDQAGGETAPGQASPSNSPATAPNSKITLVAPDTIGTRKKSGDATMNQALDGLEQSFGSLSTHGIGEPVAAVYGDVLNNDLLMLVAFPVDDTSMMTSQFDLIFSSMSSAMGGHAGNITDVPPGPLGGKARCGDVKLQSMDVAFCAWGDDGSIGMVFWYFATVSKVRSEFIPIREQVEQKS